MFPIRLSCAIGLSPRDAVPGALPGPHGVRGEDPLAAGRRQKESKAVASLALTSHSTGQALRRYWQACCVAGGVLLFGCLLYLVEKYWWQPAARFVENPADVTMRAFGLSHFLVGWLFLLTSPRCWTRAGVIRLASGLLAGTVLCAVYASLGGMKNPLLVLLFYSYFLAHEVRDELMLYRRYEPSSAQDSAALDAFARVTTCFLVLILAATLLSRALIVSPERWLEKVDGRLAALIGAVLALATVSSTVRFVKAVSSERQRVGPRIRAFLHTHRALCIVYGCTLLLLATGLLAGSNGLNLVILIHVSAWLVFVNATLNQQAKSATGLWQYVRTTGPGFVVLHLSAFLAVLTILALRVYVWQRVGLVSQVFATCNFCYWGIMHITIAFATSR